MYVRARASLPALPSSLRPHQALVLGKLRSRHASPTLTRASIIASSSTKAPCLFLPPSPPSHCTPQVGVMMSLGTPRMLHSGHQDNTGSEIQRPPVNRPPFPPLLLLRPYPPARLSWSPLIIQQTTNPATRELGGQQVLVRGVGGGGRDEGGPPAKKREGDCRDAPTDGRGKPAQTCPPPPGRYWEEWVEVGHRGRLPLPNLEEAHESEPLADSRVSELSPPVGYLSWSVFRPLCRHRKIVSVFLLCPRQ